MIFTGDLTFFVKRFKSQEEGKADKLVFVADVKRVFEEGSLPVRKTLDVLFTKANFPDETLNELVEDVAYTLDVKKGWLTINRFKKKGSNDWCYNLALQVHEASIKKATKVNVEKREESRERAKAVKKFENYEPESPLDSIPKWVDSLPF